eukprot:SAG25_NODE_689_length_5921_cov_14.049296_5_plen_105_part_00
MLGYVDDNSNVERPSNVEKKSILWKVPFCEQLGHSDMIRLSTKLKYMRVQPPEFDEEQRPARDQYIMKQGEYTNDMFVIIEGMVRECQRCRRAWRQFPINRPSG